MSLTRRALLASGAVAFADGARAQTTRRPVIGYLSGRSLATDAHLLRVAQEALKEEGFVEGQNVTFEYRWADGDFGRLKALATELVARKPDLIMAVGGTPVSIEAQAATSTIPIIFTIGFDPVKLKLVGSLARPGGNATGAMLVAAALEGKRLDLLKEMRPDIGTAALLVNSTSAMMSELEADAQRAAAALGLALHVDRAATVAELDRVLADLATHRPGALAVSIDGFLISQRQRIIDWAARERVPAIYPNRDFTDAGGLASYSPRWEEAYRWAGLYAGRVLKGARPGDLPIQQPTTYELVVNLRTARAMGLALPPAFVARADEAIE